MSIYSVYLRNGVNWILKSSDPTHVEFPAGTAFDGWTLFSPLMLPAKAIGRGASLSPLTGGRVLVSTDRIDFRAATADQDAALIVAEQILRWLRFSTGQARLGTNIVGHQLQADDVQVELLHIDDRSVPVATPVRHVEFSGVTFELLTEALRQNPTLSVPLYSEVLLDAIEASLVSDPRKAILYSAIAVEVMASTRIQEAFDQASVETPHSLRVIEVDQSGGRRIRKDPIFDELQKTSQRNFKFLLHELPLYVERHSVMLEDASLYRELLLLHTTRNDLVHRASLEEGDRLPLDHSGMHRALDAVVAAFRWFGAAGRYVTMRNELDAGWTAKPPRVG
jgi:hypothetical protein